MDSLNTIQSVVLDSSVVIGLVFRNAGERQACESAIPSGAKRICPRYVIFEVSKGYLSYIIRLHNHSLACSSLSDLLIKAKKDGYFRPYRGGAQIDAFIDYQAELELVDGPVRPSDQLLEFRVTLWRWIRMGWEKMTTAFEYQNLVGCHVHLPGPRRLDDGLIEHELPIKRCGTPSNCDLQLFVDGRRTELRGLAEYLNQLPLAQQDSETKKRIESLRRITAIPTGNRFKGADCHRCGDALICFEALSEEAVVTKNGRHFNPIAEHLGIATRIAQHSDSTRPVE